MVRAVLILKGCPDVVKAEFNIEIGFIFYAFFCTLTQEYNFCLKYLF